MLRRSGGVKMEISRYTDLVVSSIGYPPCKMGPKQKQSYVGLRYYSTPLIGVKKKQLPSYKAIYRGYFKTILGAHPVSLYPYEKTIKSSGRGPEQCGNFAKNNIFNQSIDIPKDPDMP